MADHRIDVQQDISEKYQWRYEPMPDCDTDGTGAIFWLVITIVSAFGGVVMGLLVAWWFGVITCFGNIALVAWIMGKGRR